MKSKLVKFRRGFKKRTHKDIVNEILNKTISKTKIKTNHLVRLVNEFKLIPDPTDELDWLVQFNEPGQSYDDFISNAPFDSSKELGSKKFIYYIQIGDYNKTNLDFNDLIKYSMYFFNEKPIKIMPLKIDIIKHAKTDDNFELKAQYDNHFRKITHRYDSDSNKLQIRAQSLFNLLKLIKPKDAHCLIGFTEMDLFVEQTDLFVAGLCDGAHRVGVFSCFRYDPTLKYSEQFWYKTKNSQIKNKQMSLLLSRSSKLLVHETCHLLGIDHCVYLDCCMNGSGHLKEDFRQSMFLCPIDLNKLAYLFDFDLIERYENLKRFFTRINSKNEVKWLNKMISLLKNE